MDRILLSRVRRSDLACPKLLFAAANVCILDDGSALVQRSEGGSVVEAVLGIVSSDVRDRTCRGMQEREIRYDARADVYTVMHEGKILAARLPERVLATSARLRRPSEGPLRLSGQSVEIGPARRRAA